MCPRGFFDILAVYIGAFRFEKVLQTQVLFTGQFISLDSLSILRSVVHEQANKTIETVYVRECIYQIVSTYLHFVYKAGVVNIYSDSSSN